jgi:hypothetical protein
MVRTGHPSFVVSHVGGEDAKRTADKPDSAIRVSTGTTTVDFVQSTMESTQQTSLNVTVRQAGQIVGDGREAEDTRTTLARTLICQIAGDTRRLRYPARRLPEYHDHADSGGGADEPERSRRIVSLEMLRGDPGPAVAADKIRLGPPGRRSTLGDLVQRRAAVDLDDPRVGDVAPYGDEAGPRFLDHSSSQKRGRPPASDESDVGQRLGVVHQGGVFPEAQWRALFGPEDR